MGSNIYVKVAASISIYNEKGEFIEELEWNSDYLIEYNADYDEDTYSICINNVQ